jgi:teichuronic acid biosynthesis glycosyltransferase TuaG
MNDKPIVSIITPCYNSESYIKETINSVIQQTFKEWELIIVDDCSTDSSPEIIKSFCFDKRIKYFKTERNSGSPALPRNIGIQESRGEYIAFLDSDDLWLPNKLESQIKFSESNDASFIYSNYSIFCTFDSIGGIIKAPRKASYKDLLKRDYIPMLTVLIRKDVLKGVEFSNRPQEDYVFLLNILKRGIIAFNNEENVALYRVVHNSRSRNKIYMFYQHYRILREENLSVIRSICYVFYHSFVAFLKYRK